MGPTELGRGVRVGFVTKAMSPLLPILVGYGFLRVKKWSLLVYLVYAIYGTINALVNLTCLDRDESVARSSSP